MEIELKPVNSTNIHSIGYDEPSKTLVIRFHNNSTYKYNPVTPDGHLSLIKAESIASFFFKNIRNNSNIKCTKLETDAQ